MRASDKLPKLVAVELHIPKDIPAQTVTWDDLPEKPGIGHYRDIGDRWLEDQRFAILNVPSLVIGVERNFVLNPAHPDFHRVQLVSQQDFKFDNRMGA